MNIVSRRLDRENIPDKKELHAIKQFEKSSLSANKFCVVIYSDDGFIITSYFVRKLKKKYLL